MEKKIPLPGGGGGCLEIGASRSGCTLVLRGLKGAVKRHIESYRRPGGGDGEGWLSVAKAEPGYRQKEVTWQARGSKG